MKAILVFSFLFSFQFASAELRSRIVQKTMNLDVEIGIDDDSKVLDNDGAKCTLSVKESANSGKDDRYFWKTDYSCVKNGKVELSGNFICTKSLRADAPPPVQQKKNGKKAKMMAANPQFAANHKKRKNARKNKGDKNIDEGYINTTEMKPATTTPEEPEDDCAIQNKTSNEHLPVEVYCCA